MKLSSLLQRIVVGGTYALAFTPIIVTSSLFYPYITGKAFFFRIITLVIFGAWVVLAISDVSWRPKKGLLLTAILFFLVIIGVADFFSENPFRSFWSNFERMEGYVTLVHLFLYFLVASSVFQKTRRGLVFFDISVGVSAGISLFGLLALLSATGAHARLDIMFGNATYVAGYVLVHIFLALFLAFRKQRENWTMYYAGVILFQLLALYYTATRGAVLALIIGSLTLGIGLIFSEKKSRTIRTVARWSVVIIVLVCALFISVRSTGFVQKSSVLHRFSTISLENAGPRLTLWKIALEGVRERPILGWGQESFLFVFNKYYRVEMHGQESWFDRTHNVFLDWLIAGGSLGLLSYLFLFASALWLLWTRNSFSRNDRFILTSLLLAYTLHNLLVFDNITSYLFFFSLLAFIHAEVSNDTKTLFSKLPSVTTRIGLKFTTSVVGIFVVIGLYTLHVPNIRSAYYITQGQRSKPEAVTTRLSYFEKAIAENGFGAQEAREQLFMAADAIAVESFPDPAKKRSFDLAKKELEVALAHSPKDARLVTMLAALHKDAGRVSEAIAYFEKALLLSPDKQQLLLELSVLYSQNGNPEKGLAYMERVRKTNPEDLELTRRYLVAAAYALRGDIISAQYAIWPKEYQADPRMLEAYYAVGKFEQAVRVGEMIVHYWPDNFKYHLMLANAYLAVNKREEAKHEIEKAMHVDPKGRSYGETLLRQIDSGEL